MCKNAIERVNKNAEPGSSNDIGGEEAKESDDSVVNNKAEKKHVKKSKITAKKNQYILLKLSVMYLTSFINENKIY